MAIRAIRDGLFTMPDDPGAARLLGGYCGACTRVTFPVQALCPYCGADACEPRTLGAEGVVEVCTTVTNRPPGYEGPLPFGFGVVELPDGIRIVARLREPDRVHPGMPVRFTLDHLGRDSDGNDLVTYAFEPLPGSRVGERDR